MDCWTIVVAIATAIGALATAGMAFATFRTLNQNREQLNELKHQWDEEQRPRIRFSCIFALSSMILKITNVGKETAYNITLNINEDFIDIIPAKHKARLKRITKQPISIEGGVSKYFILCTTDDKGYWDPIKEAEINIEGTYNTVYNIYERFNVGEFIFGSTIVNDNMTDSVYYIKKGLIVQNDEYMPIQKSLDIIAKKVGSNKIEEDTQEPKTINEILSGF